MPILRNLNTETNFTIISNDILQNEKLSYESKGVLTELLSRPNNWTIYKSQLQRVHTGESKLNRIFKELKEYGYLFIVNEREDGKIKDRFWIVTDKPLKQETFDIEAKKLNRCFPQTEETSIQGNHGLQIYNNNKDNKDIQKSSINNSTGEKFSQDDIEYILSKQMLDLIFERKPNFQRSRLQTDLQKEQLIQKWCKTIHIMLKRDKIEPDVLLDVMEYSAKTPFFAVNVLSVEKLRKRFDEIEMQMSQKGLLKIKTVELKDNNKLLTERIIKMYGILIGNTDYQPLNDHEREKFIKSSKKMVEFYASRSILNENWVKYLGKCLIKNYKEKGEVLHAGHLCGEHTWSILMPQFLEELGIGR